MTMQWNLDIDLVCLRHTVVAPMYTVLGRRNIIYHLAKLLTSQSHRVKLPKEALYHPLYINYCLELPPNASVCVIIMIVCTKTGRKD